MRRRELVKLSTQLSLALAIPTAPALCASPGFSPVCSAANSRAGGHQLGVWQDNGWEFRLDAPLRGHDVCLHLQQREVVFFERRPGRYFYVVDGRSGRLHHRIAAQAGHHFYGHGIISADGRYLYTTENNAGAGGEGVIGVYDCQQDYRWLKHLDSGGIGPHELALMPGGEELVVAIGGLKTLPSHGRKTLNPDHLRPGLAYINLGTEQVSEFVDAPHPQLSLRHLDVSVDGDVIVGAQYQGPVPSGRALVYRHRRGGPLEALQANNPLPLLRDYVASVACDDKGNVLCSMPRDNLLTLWSINDGRFLQSWHLRDSAGACYDPRYEQFVVSNGRGQLMAAKPGHRDLLPLAYAPGVQWDNHLVILPEGWS